MQINKSTNISSLTTAIIHTVTAGKILNLKGVILTMQGAAGGSMIKLFVRNAGDTLVYEIASIYSGSTAIDSTSLLCDINIPAGYDVCISITTTATTAFAFITGSEV